MIWAMDPSRDVTETTDLAGDCCGGVVYDLEGVCVGVRSLSCAKRGNRVDGFLISGSQHRSQKMFKEIGLGDFSKLRN
jgi:hypothetical protein